jgi:hypothetical protein
LVPRSTGPGDEILNALLWSHNHIGYVWLEEEEDDYVSKFKNNVHEAGKM